MCEECPICLETPTEKMTSAHGGKGFKIINGCGHQLCWGCDKKISTTPNQFVINKTLGKAFIKCPLCRSFDKPSNEELQKRRDFYKNKRAYAAIVRRRLANPSSSQTAHIQLAIPESRYCENSDCISRRLTVRKCPHHILTPCCRECKKCDACL